MKSTQKELIEDLEHQLVLLEKEAKGIKTRIDVAKLELNQANYAKEINKNKIEMVKAEIYSQKYLTVFGIK